MTPRRSPIGRFCIQCTVAGERLNGLVRSQRRSTLAVVRTDVVAELDLIQCFVHGLAHLLNGDERQLLGVVVEEAAKAPDGLGAVADRYCSPFVKGPYSCSKTLLGRSVGGVVELSEDHARRRVT